MKYDDKILKYIRVKNSADMPSAGTTCSTRHKKRKAKKAKKYWGNPTACYSMMDAVSK